MTRENFVSLSRLLVSAGYASKTSVHGEQLDFELTPWGQMRMRELFSRLRWLPEPGSPERLDAVLEIVKEMKTFTPSTDEIEALVAVSLRFCDTTSEN